MAILSKYSNYVNVFLKKLAIELLKRFNINKYLINLKSDQQPPHIPIYGLGKIELKILKFYIEINLANDFISPFNSLAKALILFI